MLLNANRTQAPRARAVWRFPIRTPRHETQPPRLCASDGYIIDMARKRLATPADLFEGLSGIEAAQQIPQLGLTSVEVDLPLGRREQLASGRSRDQAYDGRGLGALRPAGLQVIADGLTRNANGLGHLALPGRAEKGLADLTYFRRNEGVIISHVRG